MKGGERMPTVAEIKTAASKIGAEYGLKKMYLFGSYAKGTASKDSDVDLLFEKGRTLSLLGVSSMLQSLREKLNVPVDLVSAENMESDFAADVNATRILLYEN